MNKQISLSGLTDELAQAKTRKKEVLEQTDRIIPWDERKGIIKPYYYKGERGNKPFDLGAMLRIHLLQNLYDLSDMGAMTEVIDSSAFSEFYGMKTSNQVSDGDTIGSWGRGQRLRRFRLSRGRQTRQRAHSQHMEQEIPL